MILAEGRVGYKEVEGWDIRRRGRLCCIEVNGSVVDIGEAKGTQVSGGAARAVIGIIQLEVAAGAERGCNERENGGDVRVGERGRLAVVPIVTIPRQRRKW